MVALAALFLFGVGKSYLAVILRNILREVFDFWRNNLDKERARHTQILGATGSGKSSLIEYLVDSNIRKRQGFLLIEPHGELIYRVLHNKRFRVGHSSQSYKNILYLDFDNNPPEFNFFRLPLPKETIRKQVFIDGLSSDITDALALNMRPEPTDAQVVMLRNLLIACFHLPNARFLDLINLLKSDALTSERFRQLLSLLPSPVLQEYFEHDFLSGYSRRTRDALRIRLNNLIIPRQLYLSLCGDSCEIDFDSILEQKKFVMVRASVSLLGEYEAVSIGNLIHNLLSKYAFERLATGQDNGMFFTYFDEAQYYVNKTVQKSLTGTRKTGLNYTLAHHELSQGNMSASQQRTVVNETNVKFYGAVKWKDESEAQKILNLKQKGSLASLRPGYFYLVAGSVKSSLMKVPSSFAISTKALGLSLLFNRYMSKTSFYRLKKYLLKRSTASGRNNLYQPGAIKLKQEYSPKYRSFSLEGVKPKAFTSNHLH